MCHCVALLMPQVFPQAAVAVVPSSLLLRRPHRLLDPQEMELKYIIQLMIYGRSQQMEVYGC